MSRISVEGLTFCYDGSYENIFEDVSFAIDTDWKLGLVGRNGRGKTTFLKLLLGELAYGGRISASVEFDYFPYEVQNREKNTIDIVEEIYPAYEFWELAREWSWLSGADDVWYRPFESLSNGEQTKMLLAVLFLKENNFLLIDEPTNHLDEETREVVCAYLKRKKGFLAVSHDRAFLDGCIDHVLAINRSNIEVAAGNFSSWWENKKRRDAFELAENERLKKEIKRLSGAARQAEGWADKIEGTKIGRDTSQKDGANRDYIGEKSRRMQQRRKNLERRREQEISRKQSLLQNIESEQELRMECAVHHKQTLLAARDITLSYGDRTLCAGVSFEVHPGDCIVFAGQNGSGKSSMLRAVLAAAGRAVPAEKNVFGDDAGAAADNAAGRTVANDAAGLTVAGTLKTAGGLKISYVPQDAGGLSGYLRDYIREAEADETLFLQFLRKFDFPRSHFEKRMEEFSEGQRKKVLLARSLCERAHLYIWDEPLNFIDIFSRMQLEEVLVKYRPAMLLVEHDAAFTARVGTRIVHF